MISSKLRRPLYRNGLISLFTALIFISAEALGGSYSQNFNAAALNAMTLGDGSTITASAGGATTGAREVTVGNNALQMMATGLGGASSAYKLPDLDPLKPIQSFDASFTVKMAGSGLPGAGWSLNFGAIPVTGHGTGDGGFVMTGGLTIAWDAFNNGGGDVPSIQVFAGGTSVGNAPQTFAYDETYRTVAVHWDLNGLDVTYGGVAIFTDLAVSGFVPLAGHKFAFSARNESSNTMNTFLDDVLMTTVVEQPLETGGPVISEFMADNANGLEDEDTDKPDWIEIYNGQNAVVNLAGWRLTNAAGNNALWTFPVVSIPAYGHLVVYASGKNRTVSAALLHTNFTLQKESGYLALVRADGTTIASQFSYGAQFEDVSYGEKGSLRTLGYLQPVTPGTKTNLSTQQAAGGPAEYVVWSRDGGLITGATSVTITAPLEAGAVVRYTTDNTEPGAGSAIYTPGSPPAAFTFAATKTLRARVFASGKLPGDVTSRIFLLIDASLATNYNNSGQPFSSNLPIIVLESFGVPVDTYSGTTQREYRFTYAVVIAPNPVTGRATITDAPDFQGRCGTHVRGESSAGFPQKQYAWELWDNQNNDKDAPILGLPSESDWILYAPWSEKTLMRDVLTFDTMRRLRSDYPAARTKFCELIFNQTTGAAVGYSGSYKGIYVLKEKLKIDKDRLDLSKLNSFTTQSPAVTGGYIFRKDKPDADSTSWNSVSFGVPLMSYDPDVLNSAQLGSLSGYVNSMEGVLNGGNFANLTTGYAAWIDTASFIDAQWFVEWTKQVDGYVFSTYFHKDRNGKMRCGPLWDFNIAIGNADYGTGDSPTGWLYDTGGTGTGTGNLWWPRLHADPWYRLRHFDRWWEMRRTVLATPTILGEIDAYRAFLLNGSTAAVTNTTAPLPPAQENGVMRHYRKYQRLGQYDWPNPPGTALRTTYQSEVDYMKTWLTTRLAWLDDQNFSSNIIFRPPNFSLNGGSVPANYPLTMSAYTGTPPAGKTYATGGTIYYTLDGTDPRNSAGSVAATATAYSGAVLLNSSKFVRSRYKLGTVWSPLNSATFIVNAVPASDANLVISELHYNPAGPTAAEMAAGYTSGNDFEFIELLNVGTQNIDLTDCAFTAGITFDFASADPTTLTLAPGGRVILVGNKSAFLLRNGTNPAVKIAGEFSGNLSSSGELLTLLATNGTVIASFAYITGEPWPADANGPGFSLVLNNPIAGLNYTSSANWRSSGNLGGSPGLSNSAPFPGSPTGDTDGDGLSDYFEYATGSNMGSATSLSLPITTLAPFAVAAVTQNYFKFEYRRNLAADGVKYSVLYSSDLLAWPGDPSVVTYVGTHNNGDGTATVTYRSTQPCDAAHPRMFMRLSISP